MVFGEKKILIFEDDAFGLSHVVWCDAFISREPDRFEPEFAFTVGIADVDVRRLIGFFRVEMKTKRADAQYRGH